MVELRTERLRLRPWDVSDAPVAYDIRRRESVSKWLGSPEPWTSVDQAKQQITDWNDDASGPVRNFAIVREGVSDERPVGLAGLGRPPAVPTLGPEVEIGWWLHPDATGHGYASEAAAAVLAYGFEQGLSRIWAFMWPHNAPSAKVARAIGMNELGVLVDPWYGTDEFAASLMFLAHRPD